jgi:cytoskeletal protein CcmA (bactofilin family)
MSFNKVHEARGPHDPSNGHHHAINPHPLNHAKLAGVLTRSVIDQKLLITGDVEGNGELLVEGKVAGNIRCAQLLVGNNGMITGNVSADEVVVRGEVNGTIRANRVILQDSARVNGEVFHKLLTIEAGAHFEGAARRSNKSMKAEALNPCAA